MGPSAVVAEAPPLDGPLRIGEREESVLVQMLVAQPAVKRFDERVITGFPGRLGWSCTPCWCAHASSALLRNSGRSAAAVSAR